MEISLRPYSIDRISRPETSPALAPSDRSASGGGQSADFGPAYAVELSAKGKALAAGGGKADESAVNEPRGGNRGSGSRAVGGANSTKKADGTECQTCKSRMYQDGSNEGNVSFKAPGHIAPGSSAAVVMSHEREHVSNAKAEDAADENKQLVSCSVRLYTATCPECGRVYTAGGETQTVMKTTQEKPAAKTAAEKALGQNVDIAA